MQTTGVDAALCQISYGFRSRVTSYGAMMSMAIGFDQKSMRELNQA